MPYPAGHRSAVRKRIIDSARGLFNLHGFEAVSIQKIMERAGLTHGGYYSYFESKSDLYAEVLSCFVSDSTCQHNWKGAVIDKYNNLGPQVVRAYLSRQHFEDVETSCPMVALPTDVSSTDKSAKAAFE